jgi:hypothetical protein
MVQSISRSEKTLRASVEVVHRATPRALTPFWGINAELVAALIKRHEARFGGPRGVCRSTKLCTAANSARNQRGSLKKVLLRPTVSASLNLPAGLTKKWGTHDHR